MIGEILNQRYQLHSELGRGGMGIVYRGHDLLLDRDVAVKVLSKGNIGTQGKTRLLNEAQAIARLNHPHIVSVYDAGEANETPFIVVELIEGRTLHDNPPDSLIQALDLARQICLALEHAHSHSIIHRDLKPENVIVTPAGVAKLMDFGMARSSATRPSDEDVVSGTVFYMAPEQALGGELDRRADLYALGVMLYEMVTGRLPFEGEDPLLVISQHLYAEPDPPSAIRQDIPRNVDDIILKLMAKKSVDRFGDAHETALAIENAVRSLSPSETKSRGNLPVYLTSFVGRERELLKVQELLRSSRLLTLTGVGGTGKTRLAVQAAIRVQEDYPDGVYLVELAGVTDPDLTSRAVALALDIREDNNRPVIDILSGYLRRRHLLLVLDNCEHLLQSCAGLANRLLSTCPELKILATSRENLGLPGETSLTVPSLELPDKSAAPDKIWQSESGRLFLDRASAAHPGFSPDAQTGAAVTQICSRLDGIPLAIELAAARVRSMPVDQIAARLKDRFHLLTGGSRAALPRQQTLHATIDWSYELLGDTDRLLLERLSVFVGGWTIEAVEAVAAGPGLESGEVLDALLRLVDKSLVLADTQNGRFRMLETIRQYGREKLFKSGQTDLIRNQHLAYFTCLAAQAAPEFLRANQISWYDRFEMEIDNLRTAFEWGLADESGIHVLTAAQLLWECRLFWMVRGYWTEGLQWSNAFLGHPCLSTPGQARINLLNLCGFLTQFIGDLVTARAYFNQVITLEKEVNYPLGRAFGLLGIAFNALQKHEGFEARQSAEESLAIFRRLEHEQGTIFALSQMGNVIFNTGDSEDKRRLALGYFNENLKLCQRLGHQIGVANTLMDLTWVEIDQGNFELVRPQFLQALEIYRQSRDKSGTVHALNALGLVSLFQARPEEAEQYYLQALPLQRELASVHGVGVVLISLGEIARMRKDYSTAQKHYLECLEINRSTGQVNMVAIALHNLGWVALHCSDPDSGQTYFTESLKSAMCAEVRPMRLAATCVGGLGGVALQRGNAEGAAQLLGLCEALLSTSHPADPSDRIELDWVSAQARVLLGDQAFENAFETGKLLRVEDLPDLHNT